MAEVDAGNLADLFGVTKATIYSWVKNGCPYVRKTEGRNGYIFDSKIVINWREKKAVLSATGNVSVDIDEAKRRKLAAEASLAELELAKEMGSVANLNEVQAEIESEYAELNSRIRRIPERCVLRLIGENNETQIKKIILDEIDGCLSEFSG